ncbi:unnamed protein product [Diatraea saccharalis]|uniref:Choline transporter-like protein n=1 Tax=Diatraea saccharalis TaxID=40085 RepID=A0A9P0G1D0_9NEOP|nr:unnamed protein product [Diatraea saccharalis]
MGKDYGEPLKYDPDFKGPIHNRSCTDIIWLLLFIVFLGGWGFVGYYSMKNGDVRKLLAPIDTKGRRCGLDSGLENKKYLMFFNIARCLQPGTPITGCPTPQVCVEKCPGETILFETRLTPATFNTYRNSMVCTDEVNMNSLTYDQALTYMRQEKCASYVLKSQPVVGRCLMNVTEAIEVVDTLRNATEELGLNVNEVASQINALVNYEQLSAQIVQDLVQSRWYMAGALVGVVVICFLYILLLRWVVTPVVWASIACLLGALAFSLYLCYNNYIYYRNNPVSLHQTTNLKGYAESIFSKKETWLGIMIVVSVVLLVLLLIVIFLRKRITIAIALIQEGSKAIIAIKTTVFFPIIPCVLQCAVIAYGIFVLMFIMSMGESAFRVVNLKNDTSCDCRGVYTEDYVDCNPATFTLNCHDTSEGSLKPCNLASCHFTGLDSPTSVIYLHLVNLLAFFWTMFFISGVSDMMLASTFSTWYWTFHKRDLPFFTLTAGICRTLRYHLGTVAFGALIIAIVRVIRVILEYIDHKIKKFDNPFTRCILCFCKCFFWCLENFLKFINKNAYIMCAVHGRNFCKSARDAFSLLMRNIIRVVVLDKVTDFIFFLSKLLISIGVGFAVYYLVQWNLVYEVTQGERLHYSYTPAIILSIATYLISSIFFNVYSMAVDTLFLCFLEDCERNDGSSEKPYYMSKNLMRILGKHNRRD